MYFDSIANIPLRGRDGRVRAYAIVDASVAKWVRQWRWFLSPYGYAMRHASRISERGRTTVYLHRELLSLTHWAGLQGDHVNLDKLDDRLVNLRVVTHAQNHQNLPHYPGTSAYRGVSWHRGKWRAHVMISGKQVYLGRFVSEIEAANAARDARLRLMTHTVEAS